MKKRSQPIECGKVVEIGSTERCRYAKGHEKPCWRYLSVTKRRDYVPGTSVSAAARATPTRDR